MHDPSGPSPRANGCLAASSVALLAAGVMLSHRVEPGVRVEAVTLAEGTPALRFMPIESGPHPVALLAHGITASKETLFRFGEALAAAGFVSFAVDLPGHGQSSQPFHMARLARENANLRTLEEVARALGTVEVFVGHSMGAGAGAAAVRDGGLNLRLFIAAGANPGLGEQGPPLLLLAGRFEELLRPDRLKARTDARVVISPWSDHALEPFDSCLVDAAVQAACAAVGKAPPPPPTCWRWRIACLVFGVLGALGLGFLLPEFSPRLARVRGLLLAALVIAALAFTAGSWFGAALRLHHAHLLLAAIAVHLLVVLGASWLRIPRWSLPALAAAGALGSALAGAPFIAFLGSIVALVLLEGAALGALAAYRGSRRDGDIAMALFAGYVAGQWLPGIF